MEYTEQKAVKLTFGKSLSTSQITPHCITHASFDLGTGITYAICKINSNKNRLQYKTNTNRTIIDNWLTSYLIPNTMSRHHDLLSQGLSIKRTEVASSIASSSQSTRLLSRPCPRTDFGPCYEGRPRRCCEGWLSWTRLPHTCWPGFAVSAWRTGSDDREKQFLFASVY